MTIDEFNEKYKEYLETGHYGLAINIPKVIDFLDKIFTELILIPNFKYSQIKMKFGTSRFYSTLKEGTLSYIIEKEINRIYTEETIKLLKEH